MRMSMEPDILPESPCISEDTSNLPFPELKINIPNVSDKGAKKTLTSKISYQSTYLTVFMPAIIEI